MASQMPSDSSVPIVAGGTGDVWVLVLRRDGEPQREVAVVDADDSMAEVAMTVTALGTALIDGARLRRRELSCPEHRGNKQPTLCAVCALANERRLHRGRTSRETWRPVA